MGAHPAESLAALTPGDMVASGGDGVHGVDRGWAQRIRAADRRVLVRQFSHEAAELHRLLSHEQHVLPPAWRDFRCFLADVGPSPGPRFRLRRTADGVYRPGAVVWAIPPNAPAASPQALPPNPRSTYSQWTMISGFPVQYSDVASKLGVSFAALSEAAREGGSAEALAERAREAAAQVDDLDWVSQHRAHQPAFRTTRMSRFLHTVGLAWGRCGAGLEVAGCWRPLTGSARAARDASPAWKTYNELLPKAAVILPAFEIYRQYSLTEAIEELSQRIEAAERRFRGA